nr:aminotransferase class I/II-fold pyridoxal phosphate-dependent enzyme [Clostridia bacterium]
MKKYTEMSAAELKEEYSALCEKYEELKSKGYKLDMSRGKPGAQQLDITRDMLGILEYPGECIAEDGTDCRNYGVLDGIPEAKRIFGELLGIPAKNVFVGGNSSLCMMYDTIARAMLHGILGETPWSKLPEVKFLCPAPGYDRHFAITESMGIKMIPIPMHADGPDMDMIESLVAEDDSIKGIWCVPKYSNPEGITYSDETVRRFAALKPAAKDFRIFWDNAYAVHDLYGDGDKLLNIFDEAPKYGNEDIFYIFASTSKISFPGSGVAILAASDRNLAQIKELMSYQTIGYDKLNQLRHVRYFRDAEGILEHMKRHAEILRPKFDIVLEAFEKELRPRGVADWITPKGGYFVALNTHDGCAKRTYELVSDCGVKLTNVGAAFPYGLDPRDRTLRIAPTNPKNADLVLAVEVLCVCVRMAAAEQLMK